MCHPLIQRRTKESAGRPAVILAIAASLIACGSTAFAQGSTAEVASDIEGIVVPTAHEGPLHAAARRGGAELTQSPAPAPQAQPSWVVRHPVITGTLIGAGAGAALSCTRTVGGFNHDPRVALVGAGAGAWVVSSPKPSTRREPKRKFGSYQNRHSGRRGRHGCPAMARLLRRGRLWRRFVSCRAASEDS